MRSEDRSQQDVVYRSPGQSSGPVYHTERDCRQIETPPPIPVAREEAPDRWRECDRCRYSHVPTLEDRGLTTMPWATLLGGAVLMVSLFAAVLGGVL